MSNGCKGMHINIVVLQTVSLYTHAKMQTQQTKIIQFVLKANICQFINY